MPVSRDLVQMLARDVLAQPGFPPDLAAELAQRVSGVLDSLAAIDAERLQHLVPATAFPASHAAMAVPPGPAPWEALVARGLTGSGYGGTLGTTGAVAPPPINHPVPAPDGPFAYRSLTDFAALLRRRECSAVELAQATLERLQRLEPSLNAFVTVTADLALAQAVAADAALARGEGGPLTGVPIALKDLYETAGIRTTAGSRVLADHVPATDATAVVRLRQAGTVLVGKTATHEFAFGPTTDSPYHGPTHNPWDLTRSPAGSSGGSGAAVAAGVVACALGTDTGGSIRMPAAICGVVGLKPSYGRVSKAGVLPLSWSIDHAGPLCRTVADAAAVLQVLAGADPADPTAADVPVPDFSAGLTAASDLRGVTVGVPAPWLAAPLDEGVRAAFATALETFRGLGATVVEVDLPPISLMILVNRLITFCEAATYHARWLATRGDDYGADVRARLEVGRFLPATAYVECLRLRGELARTVAQVMVHCDALLTPTAPIPAPVIGQRFCPWGETVPDAMIRFTAPFSGTGQPAFSLPMGFSSEGLPLGLQVVGRVMQEPQLIRIAAAYERATDWGSRRPPL